MFKFCSSRLLHISMKHKLFIQPKYTRGFFNIFKNSRKTQKTVNEQNPEDQTDDFALKKNQLLGRNKKKELTDEELHKLIEEEYGENEKFEGKEAFLKKIQDNRRKMEEEKEKYKKEFDEQELREKRESQIARANIDYTKVILENINIHPTEDFKHLDEIYYFITNLKYQPTVENIMKCLQGFLGLADKLSYKDLDKPQFYEFVEILKGSVILFSENEQIISLLQFADLFFIDDTILWQKIERKIFEKFNRFTQDQLISCLVHFSNQNEGSETFYNHLENALIPYLNSYSIHQLVSIAQGFYQARRGTKEFFKLLNDETLEKVDQANNQDLVRLSIVYSKAVIDSFDIFDKIESILIPKIKNNELSIPEICVVAEAYGVNRGTLEFFQILEGIILPRINEAEFEELLLILRGFVYSYRGSKTLFKMVMSRIIGLNEHFDISQLASIARSYHIANIIDKQFEYDIEKLIISRLKNLNDRTPEELYNVAIVYNETRTGSRELYKILEFCIKTKLNDIAKDPELIKGLAKSYLKSGLCSSAFLKDLVAMA